MRGLRTTSPSMVTTSSSKSTTDGKDEAQTVRFTLFECERTPMTTQTERDRTTTTTTIESDYVAYVGGSVWAMDWLERGNGGKDEDAETPSADAGELFLALEARTAAHHAHAMRDLGACGGAGTMQIWKVDASGDTAPRVHALLKHEGGCACDAKWAKGSTRDAEHEKYLESLDAVGILAVALGDGRVEVWAVPKTANCSVAIGPKVLFVGSAPKRLGAPLCLDWNPVKRGKLAAGFSSGEVVVWNFEMSGELNAGAKTEVVPWACVKTSADAGPCRAIAWPPCEYASDHQTCASVIAYGSDYSSRPHLLDLRVPFAPVGDSYDRGAPWILDLAWLPRGSLVAGMETSDRSSAKSIEAAKKKAKTTGSSKTTSTTKSLVHQFDIVPNPGDDGTQPISQYSVPGRGAPWGIDARASSDSQCAAAMVACASSNGVVAISPMRYVSKRLRSQARPEFKACAGLLAYDAQNAKAMETNPVEPPECFQCIESGEQVQSGADLFPELAAARPGSCETPTTAQHRVKWSKERGRGWWLASVGEAGFLRLQKFNDEYMENQLSTLERVHCAK